VDFDISFDAAMLIRTGDRAARRGDLERALRCYQQAVAGHGEALFRLSDTKLVGVAEYCVDRVRALGAEGRKMYRRLLDRRASALLKRADDSGDHARLFGLVREYGLSSFGDDALNRMGNLELERGRAASAARTFGRILRDHPDTDLDRPTLLAKLAFAHELAGDESAAEGALDRLAREFGGGRITVSGKEKPVARYVADARRRLPAMAGMAPSGDRGAGSSSTWGGSERRTGFSRDAPAPAPCRLEVRFPEEPVDVLARRRLWPSPYRHVMAHAAAEGGKVFFATLTEAFAVDLATGALEWRSGVPFASLRSPGADRAFGGMPETAPTVLGGQVFCRALRRSGPDLSEICAVQARDAATGELLWSTELTEGLDGMTAVTPPCASDGRVFALFRDLGESRQLSAVCLDAAQGELLWRTPIVSGFAEVELSREKRLHVGDHAAAPAAAGGDVYFSTDLGAVAAVDAATGSVRWIANYPRARFDGNRSPRQRHLLAARAPGRVVVGEDALYVCSRDALAVRCIRRGNGDVAWSIDLADCRTVTGLVPATGGGAARLVVQGEAVECIDAASGSRLWRWTPPEASGAVFGSGALGGEYVYVPTEAALYRLRVADGRVADSAAWADLALGRPVGNLLLLRDSILGFDGRRLARLGPGAGALARKEIPGDVVRDRPIPSALPGPAGSGAPLVALWRVGRSALGVRRPPGTAPTECYLELADGLARVNAASGRVVWRTRLMGNPERLAWSPRLVVAVYPRHLVALDRERGDVLWSHALTPDASGFAFDTGDARGFGEVAAGGRYVAARQEGSQHIHVIDASTGRRKAKLELSGVRGMLLAGDVLLTGVAADGKFAVVAREPATGRELWREKVPVAPRGNWGVLSDGRAGMYFYGGDQVALFDVAARKFTRVVRSPLRDPIPGGEAGYLTLTGKRRSMALDPGTGKMLFEGAPRGGGDRGRPYRFAPGRAIHAWHEGGGFRIECRSVPGAKVLWKSEVKGRDWPIDAVAVGNRWVEICGREVEGAAGQERVLRLGYRLYDLESGRLVDTGDLPGTPTGVRGGQVSLVGERVLYAAREGVFALGGAAGTVEGAVAGVRRAASGMGPARREAAAEFIAAYERDVRRAFVPSKPIRVDGRLDDWAGIRSVSISGPLAARAEGSGKWSGPDDLSAEARIAWDARKVYVSVNVTDDVHAPPVRGAGLLTGDSVLVGLDPMAPKERKSDACPEIVVSFALARGRPAMRQLRGPRIDAPGRPVEERPEFHAVRRAGGVVYELALPWPLLRPSPDERPGKGPEMGLAVAVFDRDERAPEGAVEWGSGLVRGVRPGAFGRIRFIDITPRRIAQYRRFMELMPSHELSLRFLASIGEAQDDRATLGVRVAELERFLGMGPGRTNAVPALAELVRRRRQRGDAGAEVAAARFARGAGVAANAISDVVPSPEGKGTEGRFIRQRVYLDPASPPKTIMVQFRSRESEWAHRAYWGADRIALGRSGTPERWPAGPLPQKGRWVDLVVPVGVVGLEAHEVRALGFATLDGRAYWGRAEYHHDGKATVLVDGKFPPGGRFRGEAKPRWVDAPGGAGTRAHTNEVVEGLAEYQIESSRGLFKTRLPAAKEDAAARTARLKLYVEAASLIPENAEALELLREAEELHKDLKWPERKEAVTQMYEDFLHAAPDTTQAYEVLKRILSALGREDPATLARCESIMEATGTPRSAGSSTASSHRRSGRGSSWGTSTPGRASETSRRSCARSASRSA
jgi:outer membrane protein assembly factor BamB